ncbi:MAG TPA: hypothetical protein VK358_17470 [Longimicrobium sp.]|nr:hypothetical protein [Longimicrobium sp.]
MSEAAVLLLGRYQNIGTPEEIQRKREELERDNAKQRGEISEARAKAAPEGAIIIADAAEKARWEKVKAMPADFDPEQAAKELDDLRQKDTERTRADTARAAVKAEGWADDRGDVLLQLRDVGGATFSTKKVKEKDGKGADVEVERGFITLPGENQRAVRLSEFATEKLPAPVAALLTGSTTAGGAGRSGDRGGITYPPQQHGTGTPPAGTPADTHVRAGHSASARAGL